MIPHWACCPSLSGVIEISKKMNTESFQHTSLTNYMVNMSIMFTMVNTGPGTYVKHVPKARNKSI